MRSVLHMAKGDLVFSVLSPCHIEVGDERLHACTVAALVAWQMLLIQCLFLRSPNCMAIIREANMVCRWSVRVL